MAKFLINFRRDMPIEAENRSEAYRIARELREMLDIFLDPWQYVEKPHFEPVEEEIEAE